MRLASEAFGQVVDHSHRIVSRVDVLFDRVTVLEDVAVTAGQITYDRTAARLARCTVTVADPLLVPVASDDVLTPYGYELKLYRGVVVDGVAEYVALGVFPIQTSQVEGITLTSTMTCEDRSRLVSDARFEDDYQVASGTNYATAIEDLIADGVDDLDYNLAETSYTTPTLTFGAQEDRWDAAQQMAKSIGMELLFDGDGAVVMRPEPSFSTDPVKTIAEGSNLTSIDLALDRQTAYNRVIATSANAAAGDVFRGVATDDNSASPSYYYGPFGKRPRFYSSPFINSDEQAADAAASILASNLGVARSVNFGALPDPRLECGDVVRVTRSSFDLDDLHIIDSMQIGLGADTSMTATSRTQQEAVVV